MPNFKLTRNIESDLDTISDAVRYVSGMVNEVYEQAINENVGIPVFIQLQDLKKLLTQSCTAVQQMMWERKK